MSENKKLTTDSGIPSYYMKIPRALVHVGPYVTGLYPPRKDGATLTAKEF
jgi:hypothetical protein